MTDVRPPAPGVAAAAAAADASMHDMLRIMDVASALRRQRETAEAHLDLASAKARLRERLLATAAAAGEAVTPAEVDAAIEEYFRRQHRYEDPPPGLKRMAALAWVMRRGLLLLAAVVAVAILGLVLLVNAMNASFAERPSPAPQPAPVVMPATPPNEVVEPVPAVPDAAEQLAEAWAQFEQAAAAAGDLAADADAKNRVRGVASLGEAAHRAADLVRLRRAQQDLEGLVARLEEEYVVTIVSRPGEKSGVDRYQGGRLSGRYLIVEAVAADGTVLERRIKNAETQRTDTVKQWGELVPEPVWNRVVADKQDDGVIDEAEFARKGRGSFAETTTIPDESGKPLRRGRQITQW